MSAMENGPVHEPEIGTSRLEQTVRHAVGAIGPFPVGDVHENGVDEGVGRAFPSACVHASGRRGGVHGPRGIAELQVGDDIGGVHNDGLVIDQNRHLDAPVDGLEGCVVRLEQAVDRLEIEALEFQNHSHFAGKGAERAVVEPDHDVLLRCRLTAGNLC
jgi:hypothetical protein